MTDSAVPPSTPQADRQDTPQSDRPPENAPQTPAQQQLERAKQSLQQTLYRYRQQDNPELKAALAGDLKSIEILLRKLDRFVVRIAVFGLVSRGKSAVLNGLIGESVLATGPLNGVTRVARSLEWELDGEENTDSGTDPNQPPLRVELVDTPGLDEIEGEGRAAIAWDVADAADLILFVVAGDITEVESQALRELRTAHKPLILVFNKIDLYPTAEHGAIANRLKGLMQLEAPNAPQIPQEDRNDSDGANEHTTESKIDLSPWQPVLPVDDVVLVAAEPSPLKVREEWPDGRITYGWESPPPNVGALKTAIRTVVEREGELLLAFNALFQARLKEKAIAQKTITHLETGAENNGWQVIQLKAVLVALSPSLGLDLLMGFIADGLLIQRLAKLYGLPITNHNSKSLWRSLILSSGGLAIAEILSILLAGEFPVALTPSDSFGASLMTALIQGCCAAWGSKQVNTAARDYLETGCTWSEDGSDTIARSLLNAAGPGTLIHRFRTQLLSRINRSADSASSSDAP